MRLKFYKMQGCGNDFLILDYVNADPPRVYANEVGFLCDRHFGIGADGLVILHSSKEPGIDAAWTFYNSDGSEAQMCGNAARCAIRFLAEKYADPDSVVSLRTKAGIIKGRKLEDGRIEIALFHKGDAPFRFEECIIKTSEHMFTAHLINTGVPHAVLEVKDILTYPIDKVGKMLVHHDLFGADGSNITFFQKGVGQKIRSTTFERGVERETFACGTGAVAAAIVHSELYFQPFPINVLVPGGELAVDISPVSKMVLLQGSALHVMSVDIDEIPQDYDRPLLYGDSKADQQ